MRLSGWQRIGVVFSILWVLLVSGFAIYEMRWGAPLGEFQLVEIVPDEERASEQDAVSEKKWMPVKPVLNTSKVLTISVVPVLSTWFLIYIVFFVGRWIKNGFRDQ